jgi:hypothetical protein
MLSTFPMDKAYIARRTTPDLKCWHKKASQNTNICRTEQVFVGPTVQNVSTVIGALYGLFFTSVHHRWQDCKLELFWQNNCSELLASRKKYLRLSIKLCARHAIPIFKNRVPKYLFVQLIISEFSRAKFDINYWNQRNLFCLTIDDSIYNTNPQQQ